MNPLKNIFQFQVVYFYENSFKIELHHYPHIHKNYNGFKKTGETDIQVFVVFVAILTFFFVSVGFWCSSCLRMFDLKCQTSK